jgi:hypothetical protein
MPNEVTPASVPAMSTINGVGTVYYGEDQRKEDQSYLATSFLVLFFIPIIPLGTVRMRNLGIDGEKNHYEILKRLPMHWGQVRKAYLRGWLLMPLVLLWPMLLLVVVGGITHALYGKATTSKMMSSVVPVVSAVFAIYFIAMAAHLVRRIRTSGLSASSVEDAYSLR